MKKAQSFFSAMALSSALLALSLTGCASTKTAAASDQNKSDCKFEFGADVSAYFSGETHLNNLVPFDGEKHFAETNLITLVLPRKTSSIHLRVYEVNSVSTR